MVLTFSRAMSIASLFYINLDIASFLIIHTSQNLKMMLTFSLKLKTLEFFLESPFNTTFSVQFMFLQGKISREEIARICIAALDSPFACDKTFEVIQTYCTS